MITPTDPKVAAFIIECRKVRMYIADHPGVTSYELKAEIGRRYDMALAKLMSSKLIRFTWERAEDGRRTTRWYVVPQ